MQNILKSGVGFCFFKLMSEAASKLVGEHDFRNLCKMDVGNGVTSFKRRILSAEVTVLDQGFVFSLTVIYINVWVF